MVRIMTESVWLGSWNVNRFNAAGVLAKHNGEITSACGKNRIQKALGIAGYLALCGRPWIREGMTT